MPFYQIRLRKYSVKIIAPDAVEASLQFMEYLDKENIKYKGDEEMEISVLDNNIQEDADNFNEALERNGIKDRVELK